jgi:hypothetical protein
MARRLSGDGYFEVTPSPAASLFARSKKTANVWAAAFLEDVREGLAQLSYPSERFDLVNAEGGARAGRGEAGRVTPARAGTRSRCGLPFAGPEGEIHCGVAQVPARHRDCREREAPRRTHRRISQDSTDRGVTACPSREKVDIAWGWQSSRS